MIKSKLPEEERMNILSNVKDGLRCLRNYAKKRNDIKLLEKIYE